MPDKPNKQLIQELHQGIYGGPGTEDMGMIGDVKELVKTIKDQNTRVRKNEVKISKIWGILIGVGVIGGTGLGLGIKTLIGS